jgi:hypothetical protein
MKNLYSIETNKEVNFLPANANCVGSDILLSFGLNNYKSISKVEKMNAGSLIYRIICTDGSFILRGSLYEDLNTLESQCTIANFLSKDLFLRPIKSKQGQYVFQSGGLLWLAYIMIEGKQFAGELDQLSSVLLKTLQLQRQFDLIYKKENGRYIKNLRKVEYNAENWVDIVGWLSGNIENDAHSDLMLNIPKEIQAYFHLNRGKLIKLIRLVASLDIHDTIVHYDLQHANILINNNNNNNNIHCIDIEDIVVSDRRIAVFHGVFKWVRHCIYVNNMSSNSAVKWLKTDCINILEEEFKCKITLEYMSRYILFKLFSDLHLLLFNLIHCGKGELEYDLLKKIYNFFEIKDLFMDEL